MRKDSVLAYIKEYAKTQPDTLAVCELRKTVTYEQYFMNIRKMAAVLMSAGIQKDEHVILKCTQNINYLTIFTALQYMGALPIPVEKATMPERMTEIGAQVEAKTLISDAEAEGMRFFSAKELEKTDGRCRAGRLRTAKSAEPFHDLIYNRYNRKIKGRCSQTYQ